MTVQNQSPQNTNNSESIGNVIKGGFQEVSPSPPPTPSEGGNWGTAVPTNNQSTGTESKSETK